MSLVVAAQWSRRPLPCGVWTEPEMHAGIMVTPQSSGRPRSRAALQGSVPQAHIVSHRTGDGFTRTLRDISGTRKADYCCRTG